MDDRSLDFDLKRFRVHDERIRSVKQDGHFLTMSRNKLSNRGEISRQFFYFFVYFKHLVPPAGLF